MKSLSDLYTEINKLSVTGEPIPLNRFLIGLHEQMLENRGKEASFSLFLQIIKKALSNENSDFNEEWLDITDPPDMGQLEAFEYALQVVRFQIAELVKMDIEKLSLEEEMFGIESDDGHTWYNFDPFTNIERGIQGLIDAATGEKITWVTLGEILETGRIYE